MWGSEPAEGISCPSCRIPSGRAWVPWPIGHDPAAAATLLGDAAVWEAALARGWNDGGVALGQAIVSAALQAGEAGGRRRAPAST